MANEEKIDRRMDRLPGILKADGYPDVQAFKRLYDEATILGAAGTRRAAAPAGTTRKREHPKEAPGYGSGGQAPERRTAAADPPSQSRL